MEKEPVKLIADDPMKKTPDDTHTAANIESNIKKSKEPTPVGSSRG